MEEKKDIVFYDGDCGLCNQVVQFVLKYERNETLCFCALQSEYAQLFLKNKGIVEIDFSTFYLLKKGNLYSKSTAVLQLLEYLHFRFVFLSIGWILPKFMRDRIYDLIAKNRKKWNFDRCSLIPSEKKNRFLS